LSERLGVRDGLDEDRRRTLEIALGRKDQATPPPRHRRCPGPPCFGRERLKVGDDPFGALELAGFHRRLKIVVEHRIDRWLADLLFDHRFARGPEPLQRLLGVAGGQGGEAEHAAMLDRERRVAHRLGGRQAGGGSSASRSQVARTGVEQRANHEAGRVLLLVAGL
jgi:hypothetical protein